MPQIDEKRYAHRNPPHPTPPLCLPAFVLRGGAGQSSTPQFPSFVRSWNTNMISWGNKRGQRSKQLPYHYLWGRAEETNFSYCLDMYGLVVICFQHCNTECKQLIAVQRLSSQEIYHSQSSTTLIERKTFPICPRKIGLNNSEAVQCTPQLI